MDAPSAVSMPPDDHGPWWEAQALAHAEKAERREKWQGTLLIIVSVVLMVVSLFCLLIGTLGLIGLVGLVFFGACIFAGIVMRGDLGSRSTSVLALCAALLMGLGMGLLFIFTLLSALNYGVSGDRLVVLIIAAVGFVFFGIGGIVAIVKVSRTGRRARGHWQNRRPDGPTGR